jgi:NAD(P)-dependent dehydrogenase (short-subunit alcohol dehydrogenase family)
MSVYNATKAYVISFSEGLRRELRPKGIRVTALCPGPVPTEFQARAGIMDVHYPRGFDRSAEDVARQGYRGLMRGTRRRGAGCAQQACSLAPALPAARLHRRAGLPPAAPLGRFVSLRRRRSPGSYFSTTAPERALLTIPARATPAAGCRSALHNLYPLVPGTKSSQH